MKLRPVKVAFILDPCTTTPTPEVMVTFATSIFPEDPETDSTCLAAI